ncbi:MAG: GT4 family glycosyltransferase PelF [Candidatus Limivivens sp.]|nr:GT4 family glycosyltransferase PelF [Candidatus Limivivens sp.]
MKICLLAEGCYPYVAGGVSSWIQMLIQGMPQHEFVILAIGAEKKQKGQYKYTIPENVTEIHEYFLDEFLLRPGSRKKQQHLSEAQKQAVLELLRGNLKDWRELFELFGNSSYEANDFLMSDEFLDIIMELGENEYKNTPFKDTFWTIRSMLIPVLNLLKCDIPEADIYHSVATGYAGLLGAKFRYFTKKPYLVTEHGIYTREREEEILKAGWVSTFFKQTWISFFTSLCHAAYREADRIISLFYGARRIQISLGADPEKCSVIPNGINMNRFARIPVISDTPHPLTIGAIIRVVPIKDIKTMIYSFDLVKASRPDAVLYLIGPYEEDPDYYQECQDLISSLQCKDIHFVGRVNITDWMERLDMVILTSISEGQPFVLLEAMASHRPVLATNVGSCKEIIDGFPDEFGSAGEVVPVMNPSRIAKGILNIGKDAATMRTLAENGYRRVDKYYRDTDFLKAYETMYQEVVREWQASDLN